MDNRLAQFYRKRFKKDPVEPQDVCQADEILRCIRYARGSLDDEHRNEIKNLSEGLQAIFEIEHNSLQESLAAHTKTVANQLYDDPFRFFYELIQNADDARFHQAEQTPTISFRVNPSQLVVEINQLSFTPQEIFAICSTGASSKVKDADTTGEKGFGFKSVFGVANQVHIESGPWSFCFKHNSKDDGLGMITPILWPHGGSLSEHLTRFTLYLSDTTHKAQRGLSHHFETQTGTLLFALRKLKKIRIAFEGILGQSKEYIFEKLPQRSSTKLKISSNRAGTREILVYRTWESVLDNLPMRHDRKVWHSVVRIALPVTNLSDQDPHLKYTGQNIFAFLPVLRLPQLSFLIHADFILTANRQSVQNNEWNQRLRLEIARLFAQAVQSIVERIQPLSFTWMRFLPKSYMIEFWAPLTNLIFDFLEPLEIFLSSHHQLFKASSVRLVPPEFLHRGSMLYPNASSESFKFLSSHYQRTDNELLSRLGVPELSLTEMIDLVAQDADANQVSRLKSTELSDDWHDSFLRLIEVLYVQLMAQRAYFYTFTEWNALRILPVINGDHLEWWPLRRRNECYFANIVEESGTEAITIQVPTDIGYPLINAGPTSAARRNPIYRRLSVRECEPPRVCEAIIASQNNGRHRNSEDFLRHLEILFWFSPEENPSRSLPLMLRTMDCRPAVGRKLFFQSKKQHSAADMIRPDKNPIHQQHFINEMYQKSPVSSRIRAKRTWEVWMEVFVGIRWNIPLQDDDQVTELHPLINAVLRENPKEFVPMLQTNWDKEYKLKCTECPAILQALQTSLSPCTNGKQVELQKTWFPSPAVLQLVKDYNVEQKMALLDLPDWKHGCDIRAWPCLDTLGVSAKPQMSLYLEILSILAESQELETSIEKMETLYHVIGQQASMDDQKRLRELFSTSQWAHKASGQWFLLSDCLWDSPVVLNTRFVVSKTYKAAQVEPLFKMSLGLTDATAKDLINELVHLQKESSDIPEGLLRVQIASLYESLNQMACVADIKEDIRTDFSSHKLIHGNGQWMGPLQCVWHHNASIGQRTPIESVYPKLRQFFVDVLNVQTVTDTFMIKELVELASNKDKDVAEIQKHMLDTAALLITGTDRKRFAAEVDTLRTLKFLPYVSANDDTGLTSPDDAFFVIDNSHYMEAFRGKIRMLNFTYANFNILHPLFQLLGIEDRYLSKHVQLRSEQGECQIDDRLTEEFRECAYALSSCAAMHNSPLYHGNMDSMHEKLRNTVVYTSMSMHTWLVVAQDGIEVKVDSEEIPLGFRQGSDHLELVLPADPQERRLCLLNRLPTVLSEHLEVGLAQKQIYRILNETELDTDVIMAQERISPAVWLLKTARVVPKVTSDRPTDDLSHNLSQDCTPTKQAQCSPDIQQASTSHHYLVHQTSRTSSPIPSTIALEREPRDFHLVLENVRRQATGVIWRNKNSSTAVITSDDIRYFESLRTDGNALELESKANLFGDDGRSNSRLGAAGELFVFEILRRIPTRLGVTFDNWTSKIRHSISVHQDYRHVTKWTGTETADLTYIDSKGNFHSYITRGVLGDEVNSQTHQPWLPSWLSDHDGTNIEWFFEVKTTTGPCDTEFYMSTGQYEKMQNLRSLSTPDRQKVYCLVRVYNLLTSEIGIKFYIDPWRFKGDGLEFASTEKWRVKTK